MLKATLFQNWGNVAWSTKKGENKNADESVETAGGILRSENKKLSLSEVIFVEA